MKKEGLINELGDINEWKGSPVDGCTGVHGHIGSFWPMPQQRVVVGNKGGANFLLLDPHFHDCLHFQLKTVKTKIELLVHNQWKRENHIPLHDNLYPFE